MVELSSWFHRYNAWSFTRHRLWNSCRRAYYYRYIGSALKRSDDVDIDELKRLKKLSPRMTLKGHLVHEIIENQIVRWAAGQYMSENEAVDRYIEGIEEYQNRAAETLTEYYNGMPVEANFFNGIRTNGIDHLKTFFNVIWPQVEGYKYLRHEKFDGFNVGEVKVVVKVDYVCKSEDDMIIILDWKTGAHREEFESDVQLATYVIWAMHKYNKEPVKIRSEIVHLNTAKRYPYEFSIDELDEIKWKIKVDYREMNRTYEIDDFQAEPMKIKCLTCQFASVCSANINENLTIEYDSKNGGHLSQKKIEDYW